MRVGKRVGKLQVVDFELADEGRISIPGPVEELIGNDKMAWLVIRDERPSGARTDDVGHTEFLHRPGVGPIGNIVGRETVPNPVAGDEGDLGAINNANCYPFEGDP